MRNTVRINLKDYKVVVTNRINNGEAIGLCNYHKSEILLEIGPLNSMRSTYHHELGHAVAHEYGPILAQMPKEEQYAELVRIAIECMHEAGISVKVLKERYEKEHPHE